VVKAVRTEETAAAIRPNTLRAGRLADRIRSMPDSFRSSCIRSFASRSASSALMSA
jgi:hypothetical protein